MHNESPVKILRTLVLFFALQSSCWVCARGLAQCQTGWVEDAATTGGEIVFVTCLQRLTDGSVLVGGQFAANPGTETDRFLRMYDPSIGRLVLRGESLNAPPYAAAVLTGGAWVVGGTFSELGGVSTGPLVQFDPSTEEWANFAGSPLPTDSVAAIALLPNGGLIVARRGTNGFHPGLVTYDPLLDQWAEVPFEITGRVRVLKALRNGDILAAGAFRHFAGSSVNSVAVLRAASGTWHALANGSNATVYSAIECANGDVVLGGNFSQVGGFTVNNIVRFRPDFIRWVLLGDGVDGVVNSIAVRGNGDVVAGGTLPGAVGGFISRFDDAAGGWERLGTTLGGAVLAVEVLADGDLLIGGDFHSIDGHPFRGLARYTFGGPSCGCRADWDNSGGIDGDDSVQFFLDWQAGDADIDESGGTDWSDLSYFLSQWQQGC